MRALQGRSIALVAVFGFLLMTACGGGGTPAASPSASPSAPPTTSAGGTVNATEKDFSIVLDPTSIGAGSVEFAITNEGPSTHEFVVFETDLAPDKLPLKNGSVDEEGEGVTAVDEQEDIEPNATVNLDVTLEAGSYVIICNIPGHYQLGMRVGLTVS
ncbi:MAG TPA: sulfocyanin-like copper-binding protein [Actinomycetota bacterium]|nr:sulfocyanin-like copper-binding protein [Actinomycetota bacterium]